MAASSAASPELPVKNLDGKIIQSKKAKNKDKKKKKQAKDEDSEHEGEAAEVIPEVKDRFARVVPMVIRSTTMESFRASRALGDPDRFGPEDFVAQPDSKLLPYVPIRFFFHYKRKIIYKLLWLCFFVPLA